MCKVNDFFFSPHYYIYVYTIRNKQNKFKKKYNTHKKIKKKRNKKKKKQQTPTHHSTTMVRFHQPTEEQKKL